ncbi:MAG: hypothetical protein Q8R92_21100 [Deltaproteobacteria bacterium]|nr:hypothetical protein [Deltaproteobacteria bacterium]
MANRTAALALALYGAFDPLDAETWAGTPFVIRETQLRGLQRVLELSGPCLPFAPLSLPMRRRGRTTHYQGQPKAVQQVLGYDQGETTLEGVWRATDLTVEDTFALWGLYGVAVTPVLSVDDLRDKVYDIIRGGQEVAVRWAGMERVSSIMDFEPQIISRKEVRWRWRFEWAGEGKFPTIPIEDPLDISIVNVFDLLQKAADLLAFPAQLALDVVDFIESRVAALQGKIQELKEAVQLYSAAVERASKVANRITGISDQIRTGALDIRDHVADMYAEVVNQGEIDGVPGGLATRARLQAWITETSRATGTMAARAGETAAVWRQVAQPDVDAIIIAQGETDLRMLALQQWGSAREWGRIADYNGLGLSGSTVPAGTTLLIPARTVA